MTKWGKLALFVSGALMGGTTVSAIAGLVRTSEDSHEVRATHNVTRVYSLDQYGADPTGKTASDRAMSAVLAAIGTGDGIIQLGTGTYKFDSAITDTLSATTKNNFVLRGTGSNATKLLWPHAGGGIAITTQSQANAVQISDLAFLTSQAGGGSALRLVNAGAFGGGDGNVSNIVRVYFAGDDKTALGDRNSHYWTTAISETSVSNINFDSISIAGAGLSGLGNGIVLQGQSSDSNYSVAINISKSFFYGCGVGVTYGTYVQGLTVSQTNFVNGRRGIYEAAGTSGTDQLTVIGSEFNTISDAILINHLTHVVVDGNLFFITAPNSSALSVQNGQQITFSGNEVNGPASVLANTNGLYAYANLSQNAAVVSGNTFYHVATGVYLAPGTSNWNVQGNAYRGNITNVRNAGTANSIGVATQ